MQQEIANICPICGEKNPRTNEQCFKCGFKFAEQEELYLTVKDTTLILALLKEDLEYLSEKIIFFHQLTDETEILASKSSKKETLRRIRVLLPYFNNSFLFNKGSHEMARKTTPSEEFKKFLKNYGVAAEELYYSTNENMSLEEYRRRTLTKLGAVCFFLLIIKKNIELGEITYLEIKSDKEVLFEIKEDIIGILKKVLSNSTKTEDLSL